ncbi:hypothetical protein LMH87_009770 [Akanthomyces muscarius]|uniref:Uncharacterized protein n=1 Tax=Akanthomyces muscarius TaxID=2231603 RepID=A0A9W8QC13_AKAMU|nr:hypothetical protein LMH87_009770 [Akanthomyces muscarius]KAJ4153275.1 hypothetical protein LMH87_009770 [Akanthomyces muscarius]
MQELAKKHIVHTVHHDRGGLASSFSVNCGEFSMAQLSGHPSVPPPLVVPTSTVAFLVASCVALTGGAGRSAVRLDGSTRRHRISCPSLTSHLRQYQSSPFFP